MGRVVVKSNRLPEVIRRLPEEMDQAVDETCESMEDAIRAGAWRDSGVAVSTTKAETAGTPMHSTVGIGHDKGRGFYVIFHEFGTRKMGARPIVGPIAQAHEPILSRNAAQAVERAAR